MLGVWNCHPFKLKLFKVISWICFWFETGEQLNLRLRDGESRNLMMKLLLAEVLTIVNAPTLVYGSARLIRIIHHILQNYESPFLGHRREHRPRYSEPPVGLVCRLQLRPPLGSPGRSWVLAGQPHPCSLPVPRDEPELTAFAAPPAHDFLHCTGSAALGRPWRRREQVWAVHVAPDK
jgi:hypothetical protein